jgi:hypothetical protein
MLSVPLQERPFFLQKESQQHFLVKRFQLGGTTPDEARSSQALQY